MYSYVPRSREFMIEKVIGAWKKAADLGICKIMGISKYVSYSISLFLPFRCFSFYVTLWVLRTGFSCCLTMMLLTMLLVA